jgi:hypothetical protein
MVLFYSQFLVLVISRVLLTLLILHCQMLGLNYYHLVAIGSLWEIIWMVVIIPTVNITLPFLIHTWVQLNRFLLYRRFQ